jgi:hypothetical protein
MADNNSNAIQTSLLLYDIPDASGFGNPSGVLRSRALRINLSCWVVDNARTPWGLLHRMTEAGVHWHLLPFSAEANARILEMAAATMRRDLEQNAVRERAALERIDATLAAAETEAGGTYNEETRRWEGGVWTRALERARTKHATDRRAILKRTEKLVSDLETSARQFGVQGVSGFFTGSRNRVGALRALNHCRAELYAEATAAVAATPLAADARDDAIPAAVLADVLDEREEGSGESLRTAFADAPLTPTDAATLVGVGVATPTPAPEPRGDAYEPPARIAPTVTYTVRTRNGGIRIARSNYTDRQAAEYLRDGTDRFGRELAARVIGGRRLSASQRSWLQVLAVEATEAARPMAPPAVETVARVTAPTPPTAQPVKVAGEPRIINTRGLAWDSATRTFAADFSELGFAPTDVLPAALELESHRTGARVLFTNPETLRDAEGWISGMVYAARNGLRLVVRNS